MKILFDTLCIKQIHKIIPGIPVWQYDVLLKAIHSTSHSCTKDKKIFNLGHSDLVLKNFLTRYNYAGV
jgi:hypothetical protein